jgi:SfnB family sulfur acquisition oxidoreductase
MTPALHRSTQAAFERAPANDVPVISTDEEALDVATRVANHLAERAILRDRERILPIDEVDYISDQGLCAVLVPKERGGAGVSYVTLAEIVTRVAAADPSIAQVILMNWVIAAQYRFSGTEEQKEFVFGQLLKGYRFGNATTEIGVKQSNIFLTKVTRRGEGFRLTGKKFYTTGSLLSHYITVASIGDDGEVAHAIVGRSDPGVTIVDDWDGFGQKTTASGTIIFDQVDVEPSRVLQPEHQDKSAPYGSISQLIHAAIDAGIARAAFRDTTEYVRQYARPWRNTDLEHGYDDPYIIGGIGELAAQLHGAEALLERAGRYVDRAITDPTDENTGVATIAVAEAKILTTEAVLAVTNKLFQFAGARAVTGKFAFDRHWRNARAHTAHDPVHWKTNQVGNYHLNNRLPKRDGSV